MEMQTRYGKRQEGCSRGRKRETRRNIQTRGERARHNAAFGSGEEEPYARKVERLVLNDLLYLDNRAREDSQVAAKRLGRLTRWLMSGERTREHDLEHDAVELQRELREARSSLRQNEARLEQSLRKLQVLEESATTSAGSGGGSAEISYDSYFELPSPTATSPSAIASAPSHGTLSERECWVPVAFSRDLANRTLIPIELENIPWVIFRGNDGEPGCVHDECAHRACPLSLGQIKNGRLQCPYHGWEFASTGECEVMPSCDFRSNVFVSSLPCLEMDGVVYVWPGHQLPSASVPSFSPPEEFVTVAELAMDVDVPHGALLESLIQGGAESFKSVSEKRIRNGADGNQGGVMLKLPTHVVRILRGSLQPEARDVAFVPPVAVTSMLFIAQKAAPNIGATCDCHVYQVHVCLPRSERSSRVLYRLAIDFTPPGRNRRPSCGEPVWNEYARQLLNEEVSNVRARLSSLGEA